MHDVKDLRGATHKLPPSILGALLTALDAFSFGLKDAVDTIDPIKGGGEAAAGSSSQAVEQAASAGTVIALAHAAGSRSGWVHTRPCCFCCCC